MSSDSNDVTGVIVHGICPTLYFEFPLWTVHNMADHMGIVRWCNCHLCKLAACRPCPIENRFSMDHNWWARSNLVISRQLGLTLWFGWAWKLTASYLYSLITLWLFSNKMYCLYVWLQRRTQKTLSELPVSQHSESGRNYCWRYDETDAWPIQASMRKFLCWDLLMQQPRDMISTLVKQLLSEDFLGGGRCTNLGKYWDHSIGC